MESGTVPSNVSLTLWGENQQGYTLQLGSFAYNKHKDLGETAAWLLLKVPRNSPARESSIHCL